MVTRASSRPMTSVVAQIVSDLAYLIQTEIRLARAEVGEKISRIANGSILLGISALLLLNGIFVLLLAAAHWLEVAGLPTPWAYTAVGGAVLIVGIILALMGSKNLKASALVPDRTIEQVRADFTVAKEHVR